MSVPNPDARTFRRFVLAILLLCVALIVCTRLPEETFVDTSTPQDLSPGGPPRPPVDASNPASGPQGNTVVASVSLSQALARVDTPGVAANSDQVFDAQNPYPGGRISATIQNTTDGPYTYSIEATVGVDAANPSSTIRRVEVNCSHDSTGPTATAPTAPNCLALADITWTVDTLGPGLPSFALDAVSNVTGANNFANISGINCPGISSFFYDAADGPVRIIPSGPGSCSARIQVFGPASAIDTGTNWITVLIAPDSTTCSAASDCDDPLLPFCGGFCHDGTKGMPCDFDADCSSSLYCGPTLFCMDGSSGDACEVGSDCGSSACVTGTCN